MNTLYIKTTEGIKSLSLVFNHSTKTYQVLFDDALFKEFKQIEDEKAWEFMRKHYPQHDYIKPDITILICPDNPLSNQLKKITGDGWTVGYYEKLHDSGLIKHIKTGLIINTITKSHITNQFELYQQNDINRYLRAVLLDYSSRFQTVSGEYYSIYGYAIYNSQRGYLAYKEGDRTEIIHGTKEVINGLILSGGFARYDNLVFIKPLQKEQVQEVPLYKPFSQKYYEEYHHFTHQWGCINRLENYSSMKEKNKQFSKDELVFMNTVKVKYDITDKMISDYFND